MHKKSFVQKGFTLIELLVVIAIIAILSGIVVAGLSGAKANSRDAKRVTDIKNLQVALSQYYNDTGHYPDNLGVLKPTYIGVTLKDPDSSRTYQYTGLTTGGLGSTCNNSTRYHLGAYLESSANANLNEDADINAGSIGAITFNACGSGADFYGNSPDCGGAPGTDQCYDMINI